MDLLHQVCQRPSTTAVLHFAWDREEFRADDVIRGLGLTRSTALQAVDALVAVGLAEEVLADPAAAPAQPGRPARRFRLNAHAGAIVGVEAGGHRITAVVTDLGGTELATYSRDIAERPGPPLLDVEARQSAAKEVVAAVLQKADVSADDVASIAIGVPAPVDAQGFSPPHRDDFWVQMNAGLGEMFAAEFPAVRVENDAALAAVAEARVGAAVGRSNLVALLAGWRFGAGVYLDGALVRGASGGVGEMAGFEYVDGVGDSWGLKQLAADWVRGNVKHSELPADHAWLEFLCDGKSADLLLGSANALDPVSAPLVEYLGERLSRVFGVLTTFYDPEVIVVCGAVADIVEPLLEIGRVRMAAHTPLPVPELRASQLGSRAVSLGAAAAAREVARDLVLEWALGRRERDVREGKYVVPNPLENV